ncbi:MAG: zinc ABC transporter solute-binding protein [Syntrophaceae bacterium]|nr:zinc ABC transporter solute-binding protein [Syntrophaceae bacterium]
MTGLVCVLSILLTFSCRPGGDTGTVPGKLEVVTTLFPLYDFVRQVGGDRVHVTLLLPPGVEPHAFEPRPGDITRIQQAAVFIYTGKFMEPWAERILAGLDRKNLLIVDASRGIALRRGDAGHEDHDGDAGRAHDGHDDAGADPHVWLDFGNDVLIVDSLAAALAGRDPGNGDFYRRNAAAFREKILALDRKYRETLTSCRKKVIAHGGHFAFGYMAHRYGLEYHTAYPGFTADAEPSPRDLMRLAETVRRHGLTAVYQEELVSPKIAEAVSRETGAAVLTLHPAANISREDMEKGVTFLDLMERNLENLKRGLACP